MSHAPRRGGRVRPRTLVWNVGLAVALVAALVVWAVPEDTGRSVVEALVGANPLALTAALALYPLIPLARALRLRAALSLPMDGRRMLALGRVAAMHSMLASFVPMRLGEVSLIWLLHRAVGTPMATGSALLLVLRLLDLVVVLGAGIVALAWLPAARVALPQAGPVASVALLAVLGGLALAPALARRLGRLTPLVPGRVGRFAAALFDSVGTMTPGRLGLLLGWTLPAWGPIFLIAWLCANAAGPGVGLAGGIAGGSATALASVLPVNTVASVGTFEAAWMLALMPAGLDGATALATGVLFHAVVLVGSAVLGLLALPGGWRREQPSAGDRPEAGTFAGEPDVSTRAEPGIGPPTERG
ncbi:lysylphosphatidylglycerol synthase transmembrane domain-containing protein [Roseospira visakhapatnamensis]|uniref:Uncharacterized membrane protein YbhN (UPF0104 family) n=1 Tax=Roseospira visakhapatnamensis TaxID=390880 RepID=A0A7W6W9J8_9PROT|nr:lysylphosphatidylglycerol synthase transmembrane domain-containing protein [Roseospira visakhapatnamensis]MBB4265893.1 uncharacterized membrane protein YbhN (UPF0104 family) [Roseospira visakhapatnamensis]